MTAPQDLTDERAAPLSISDVHARIREAGGIVHGDGNIFFTRAEQFIVAAVLCGERADLAGAAAAIPEGFALVPVEPTEEMLKAAVRSRYGPATHKVSQASIEENEAADDYRAMLAAAPGAAAPLAATPAQAEEEAGMGKALRDVMAERERQRAVEGWTDDHDDEHADGSMAIAAACYALAAQKDLQFDGTVKLPMLWRWTGWADRWFKPKDYRRNLVRSAALLLAEIERLDRAALRAATKEKQ